MEHIALNFFTIIMKTSLHVENFCASLKIQRIEKKIFLAGTKRTALQVGLSQARRDRAENKIEHNSLNF